MSKTKFRLFKKMKIRQPILAIFNCGYLSLEFVDVLETANIHYLFRLSSNDYITERGQMQT